jgi:hypothetical protein
MYIFFVSFFWDIFIRLLIYDILKQKEHKCKSFVRKTLTNKNLLTFECFEWTFFFKVHIIIIYLIDLIYFSFNMYVKELSRWVFIQIIFNSSLTTLQSFI